MRLEQPLAQRGIAPSLVGGAFGLGDGDAELLRQHPHRILEADFLVQLEELEDIAADAAAETVEEALVGMNVERRRFFVMERAVALVRRPRPLQGYIFLDDRQDIGLQAKVVDELLREQTHSRLNSQRSTLKAA